MRNAFVIPLSTILGYAVFETLFYLALCFGLAMPVHPYYDFNAWSNPNFIVADTISGLLMRPNEPNDGIRVVHGDVQFYFRNVTGNSAGFNSDRDYAPKKQKPYRMIVYGDSFTAMDYQDSTWPDHLNKIYENNKIEIYNFSFNGGGLANWHHHYFHKLVEHYEFDMAIFAVCCSDLMRAFSVAETRPDGVYFNRFAEPPRDAEDLARNYRPNLVRLYEIGDRRFLAQLDRHFARHSFLALPFDLYALRSVQRFMGVNQAAIQPSLSPVSLESAKREALLGAIFKDIRTRGKLAVLVLLPWDRNRLKAGSDEEADDIRALAVRSCLPFINGYDLFRGVTEAEIRDYWPQYDAHWLKSGANRFAEMLAPELIRVRDDAARSSQTLQTCP